MTRTRVLAALLAGLTLAGLGTAASALGSDDPTSGAAPVTVVVSKLATDAERDELIKGTDFFLVDRHPQAEFHAAQFKRDGARWRADGTRRWSSISSKS